jgi:hypothetical protein
VAPQPPAARRAPPPHQSGRLAAVVAAVRSTGALVGSGRLSRPGGLA